MPLPHIPAAVRSHLGLAGHCARRGQAGVGAGQDWIELGVELAKPRVLSVDDGMPVEQLLRKRLRLRQATAQGRQRGQILRPAD